MNKISVITPVYNTEEFLEQSIQSVLNQIYENIELILINDNSNDKSKQIIDEAVAKDDRVKAFHFDQTKGVGAVRNFGIHNSTGNYVYFLDSDDFLQDDTLQLLMDHANEYDIISGKIKRSHVSEKEIDDGQEVGETELENQIELYTEDKFNLIKNNSALNRLFKKDYILKNNLSFSENVERFSDLAFMVPALLNTETIPLVRQSLYFKRKRNDPITNPALMQTGVEDQINDFTYIYNYLKDLHLNQDAQIYLDRQLLRLYRRKIVRYFRKNENVDSVFNVLSHAVQRVQPNVLRNQSSLIRKEIKVLKQGNMEKFKKVNLKHHRIRKIKTGLKGRRRLYIQLYRALFLKMPMKKDLVVFESFLGKSYSDSPKYIYEYMTENGMNYKFVWIFNEKKQIPGNPIQVKRFSLAYFYYLARAKYWVSNSRLPITLNKREGNIYLQTWHGTPLKTLVFDMKDVYSADPEYKKKFYRQSRRWDYLNAANAYSSEIFRRAFKYDKEMLEFGYPRNDILYQKNTLEDIEAFKRKMGIPTDKKVILYAPTWRDDEFFSAGKYKFTLKLELDKLQQTLGDEYIVLLRMHYFIASQMDISGFEGFAYDFSTYDDIAELYLVSDILITDYSSVFFDYANLKRPILFYTYDLEKYRDKLRGFYIDIESEVPGPLLKSTEEVISAINNIEDVKSNYKEKYDDFYERFCKWDDGRASEKTVQAVFKNHQ